MPDAPELHNWKPLLEDLQQRRERAYGMGRPQLVERQRALGKVPRCQRLRLALEPVPQRLAWLLDPGTLVEYGLLADSMDPELAESRGYMAADGMVAGIGEIDG